MLSRITSWMWAARSTMRPRSQWICRKRRIHRPTPCTLWSIWLRMSTSPRTLSQGAMPSRSSSWMTISSA
uniref:Uncharacterized protein n=1 Tax=Arundo donax TaxID=35708 RepID=A0A0A9HU14_ARUDO